MVKHYLYYLLGNADTNPPEFEDAIPPGNLISNPSEDIYNVTYVNTGGSPIGNIFFDIELVDYELDELFEISYLPETSMVKATRAGKTLADVQYNSDNSEGLPDVAFVINEPTQDGVTCQIVVYDQVPVDGLPVYLDLNYSGESENKRRITFNVFPPA